MMDVRDVKGVPNICTIGVVQIMEHIFKMKIRNHGITETIQLSLIEENQSDWRVDNR